MRYNYYPSYYANWGPNEEVEMKTTRNLWQFLPVKGQTETEHESDFVYIRNYLQKDYIYDVGKGTQAARLHRNPGTKFKIMCDNNCESLHRCQIRTEQGRKLYTSYYLNTKFCYQCGSIDWFWWSLDSPTWNVNGNFGEFDEKALYHRFDIQRKNMCYKHPLAPLQDTECLRNAFCKRRSGPEFCCCKRKPTDTKGYCVHDNLCHDPHKCMPQVASLFHSILFHDLKKDHKNWIQSWRFEGISH